MICREIAYAHVDIHFENDECDRIEALSSMNILSITNYDYREPPRAFN